MKQMTIWVRHRDIATFFWVNHIWKSPFSDRIMPLITHLGGAFWCIVLSLALLIQSDRFWQHVGVQLALSLLVSHAIVALCKKLMPRPRPYQVLSNVSTGRVLMTDASFPSGHSTAAFCKAVILASSIPDFAPLFFGMSTWVAISRVYLGQHYPSDILMGALLGSLSAWLFI